MYYEKDRALVSRNSDTTKKLIVLMQRNSKNLSCYAVEQKLLGTLHLLS